MIVSQDEQTCRFAPYEWAIRFRQPVSIVVILACTLLQFLTSPSWAENSLISVLVETLSFILVVIAAFGRIWSALYISGYKEDRVVTEGPYALVRNPLYVFSFLGALGLGLATRHLSIVTIIVGAFILYYPLVVLAEERNLQHKFGQAYLDYSSKVPRFLPRHFQLVEPDTYPVRPRHVRRSLQEIVWFFWFFLMLHLVADVHYIV
ncbi:MAG: isoprenylcysteine carboxylmethyltransferase family protein [Desulfobulbaceae bacterium]|nr:isoprenylcysteine carboxylmethyltransferase family protein [Desulfobulbaceae bacterium]